MADREALIACVKREIGMRERVYPGWVKAGRMTQEKADAELAAMRAVLALIEATGGVVVGAKMTARVVNILHDNPRPLGLGDGVIFEKGKHRIRVSIRDDELEVSAETGVLSVRPRAGNVIHLRAEGW